MIAEYREFRNKKYRKSSLTFFFILAVSIEIVHDRVNRYTTEPLLNTSGFFALEFLRSRAEKPFGQIKLSLDLDRDIIKNGTKSARI